GIWGGISDREQQACFRGVSLLFHLPAVSRLVHMSPVYTAKLPADFHPVEAPILKSPPLTENARESSKNESSAPPSSPVEAPAHRAVTSSPQPGSISRSPVPPPPTSYIPAVQRSIGQALSGATSGEESPVMNETLSVIDEHITDLSSPRQTLAPTQLAAE